MVCADGEAFAMTEDVESAYDVCEGIVRACARNFSYAIGLLPADKRRGMSAIYALARRIDDIGDGGLPAAKKVSMLDEARASLPGRHAPDPHDPVLVALADASERFNLPLDAFDDLIDGVRSDVRAIVSYETPEELVHYCRQVAGSIGRLAAAVFGSHNEAAANNLADDLGVALQLTNILRDVLEDREHGRVYLPGTELDRFGCPPDPLAAGTEAFTRLMRFQTARNRKWYARARGLTHLLEPRESACVTAMTSVYERILERIERDPKQVLRGPVGLTSFEKARIAVVALAHIADGAPSVAMAR
jgi:phytoene synthase